MFSKDFKRLKRNKLKSKRYLEIQNKKRLLKNASSNFASDKHKSYIDTYQHWSQEYWIEAASENRWRSFHHQPANHVEGCQNQGPSSPKSKDKIQFRLLVLISIVASNHDATRRQCNNVNTTGESC